MTARAIKIGETFKSNTNIYTITKQLQECVWIASNKKKESVIFKSVRHWRLQNERDVLQRYQDLTPHIRPFIDDIDEPPALVLKYLEDDVLNASNCKRLTRPEVKFVARSVLQALNMLHRDGLVHTDIKPSNVLVNYAEDGSSVRFKDVQLIDFESTVSQDSKWAVEGHAIGTPIFRSPEAQLEMRWGVPTDIWSFGAMLISLIYGNGFHIFEPDVPIDHDEYHLKILRKFHICFGPFPLSYQEIADQDRLSALAWIMSSTPKEDLRRFQYTTEREICKADKDFVCKIMKLDPRDRPSAGELLEDAWFTDK